MNEKVTKINKRIVDEMIEGLAIIDKYKSVVSDNLDYKKIYGNLFAITLRKYISNIINYYGLKYKVSVVNSYIKSSPIEWDLLILNENAMGINGTNIYNAEDCICILEIKKSGIFDMSNFESNIERQIDNINYIRKTENADLKFGYISFGETKNYFKIAKEYFKKLNEPSDNLFTFINYPYNTKIEFIEGCEDFEKYLFNLLS